MAQRARAGATFVAQLACFVVCGALGCGHAASPADAGQDADASGSCLGATACAGTAVRACRGGQLAEQLEDCAPSLACSFGRCTSAACAAAETRLSLLGCAFYTFDLDNVTSDDSIPTSVLVTNPGQIPADVALERRDGATWTAMTTAAVAPMRTVRFVLPDSHVEGGGLAAGSAFRLTSDLPVSAAHIQSDDSVAGGSTSTGGTLLLPQHVLGERYRAITYAQAATPELAATPGSHDGAGELVIVGTSDRTAVTITPSKSAALGPGAGAPPPGPDGKVHLTLDDGDVFTIFSSKDGSDLTGTEIAADSPVCVFSGNISTTYGITATGISSPDLAHEQLLPVPSWQTSYVAAQLKPQAGVCDPVLTPSGSSIWTILADRDGTTVHFAAASGAPPASDRVIGAGEAFHLSAVGDFAVTATGPIEIMQGIDCEPSLSSAVTTAGWLTDYRFGVLPKFDTLIAIVRPTADPVYFDGALIEDSLFQPAGGGYDVARIPLRPCPSTEDVCTHHLEGDKFGFTMRGMDVLSSYALTAPAWPDCIDPMMSGCGR